MVQSSIGLSLIGRSRRRINDPAHTTCNSDGNGGTGGVHPSMMDCIGDLFEVIKAFCSANNLRCIIKS